MDFEREIEKIRAGHVGDEGIPPKAIKIAVVAAVVVVALIALAIINPFVKISAGERGVLLKWGAVQDDVLGEGIHWVTPIVYDVEKMDVTIQKEENQATASSKDLQIVTTQVAINYHLDPDHVNRIYQTLRHDYSQRVIAPTIAEFVKKTTALYTAEELITKREAVKDDLKTAITASLARNNVDVDDIFITDFNFSKQFNDAIEAKVTAEQKALEAKNKLEQVKYEAEQKIAKATADARAIKIQAEAITQKGGRDYVQLQAIQKWDGKLPQMIPPGGTVPFLDLGSYTR